ncbi:MAG: hypothetical protein HWN70_06190 [Desulfobacterales bacterium]|nr:hypothetical protein [Desulfobacterales bacterium]
MDSTFWLNKPKRRFQLFFPLSGVRPAQYPEKPFKPNQLAILLVSIILGIDGGVGYGSAAEFMDRSVKTTDDLFGTTRISVEDFYLSQSSQRKNQTNYSSLTIVCTRAIPVFYGKSGREMPDFCLLAPECQNEESPMSKTERALKKAMDPLKGKNIIGAMLNKVRADEIPLTLRQR